MQGRSLKQADDLSKLSFFVQGGRPVDGQYLQQYQYVEDTEEVLFNAESSSSLSNLYIDKQSSVYLA